MVKSILLYRCDTWPVRVANEEMLEVFCNGSTRRIVHVRPRDRVTSAFALQVYRQNRQSLVTNDGERLGESLW